MVEREATGLEWPPIAGATVEGLYQKRCIYHRLGGDPRKTGNRWLLVRSRKNNTHKI